MEDKELGKDYLLIVANAPAECNYMILDSKNLDSPPQPVLVNPQSTQELNSVNANSCYILDPTTGNSEPLQEACLVVDLHNLQQLLTLQKSDGNEEHNELVVSLTGSVDGMSPAGATRLTREVQNYDNAEDLDVECQYEKTLLNDFKHVEADCSVDEDVDDNSSKTTEEEIEFSHEDDSEAIAEAKEQDEGIFSEGDQEEETEEEGKEEEEMIASAVYTNSNMMTTCNVLDNSDNEVEVVQITSDNLPGLGTSVKEVCDFVDMLDVDPSVSHLADQSTISQNNQQDTSFRVFRKDLNHYRSVKHKSRSLLQRQHASGSSLFHCGNHGCGLQFSTRKKLLVHLRDDHVIDGHLCPVCGKKFDKYSNLGRHLKQTHNNDLNFQCTVCLKYFKRKGALYKHEAHMHANITILERPHRCPTCNYAFDCVNRLNDHLKCHLRTRDVKCDICGKAFTSQIFLNTHMKSHEQRIYQCLIDGCMKKFTELRKLNFHMQVHREKTVLCRLCDKKFENNSVLKKHMLSHSNERPFACVLCPRKYKTKGSLVKHELHSHGMKKLTAFSYRCPELTCRQNIFKTEKGLADHMRIHM